MRSARLSRWRAPAAAAAVVTVLAGCGPDGPGRSGGPDVPGGLGGAQTCVSWVGFRTPAGAAADAELAVIGRVDGPAGTEPVFGVAAAAYTVTVTDVLGRAPSGDQGFDRLRVISTPVTCTGGDDQYPDGDPLETGATVALFLTRDAAGPHWRTLTPFHGVVPVTSAGELPATWPDDAP
jgi:hypothetical protein